MILPALFFYLFAGICVASAVMVIVSRNPVHSVLFLILAFVNASGLFVLMGAEFLGMVLIFVYVGAVATLFLFVIMMLDVDFTELRSGFLEYLPIGLVIGGIFLFELLLTVGFWVINPGVAKSITAAIPTNVSNTEALGLVLYTRYIHYFQLAGILLLVNVNLVAFSTFLGDIVGQVFALLVLTVAAAEAAIGLAVLVVYFRNRGSIAVEDVNLMKG